MDSNNHVSDKYFQQIDLLWSNNTVSLRGESSYQLYTLLYTQVLLTVISFSYLPVGP